MKTYIILFIVCLLTSCSTMLERSVLDRNGGGMMSIEMDLGETMKAAEEFMEELDEIEDNEDSTEEEVTETEEEKEYEVFDSTVVLYDIIKSESTNFDSLREEIADIDLLKKVNIRMAGNEKLMEMKMWYNLSFSDQDEFNAIQDVVDRLDADKNAGSQIQGMDKIGELGRGEWTLEGNTYTRETLRMSDEERAEMGMTSDSLDAETLDFLNSFIGESEYRLETTLPGKIVSVSNPDYQYKDSTLFYTLKWKEFFITGEFPGVVVEFE